jgi:hypothetical protein
MLANLCQALVTLHSSANPTQLDLEILQSLVEAGLFAAKDKDRCRPNGVRALGNIFQILPGEWILKETEHWVKEIVGAVLKNVDAGQVKVHLT